MPHACFPGGGPPIFQATRVKGEVQLAGLPEDGGKDAVRQALAKLLGVDVSQIVLPEDQRRTGTQTILFEIVGDATTAAALANDLKSGNLASKLSSQLSTQYKMNVSVEVSGGDVAEPTVKRPEGEVWEQVNGEYLLRKCPQGYLLINTTVALSACKECIPGSYSLNDLQACTYNSDGGLVCDTRDCTVCPAGATCSAGSSPARNHFVPKALQIGSTVHPVVTIDFGSWANSAKFFCDQKALVCTELDLSLKNHAAAAAADDRSYLWEYDGSLMLLRSCPPGTVLINTTQSGKFDATVQECSPCGPGRYVVDPMTGPCLKCPEGADCPGTRQTFRFTSHTHRSFVP